MPYSLFLLGTFDYHLNVEICSTINAVKCLYKYAYKGHDCVSFRVARNNDNENNDEIENYQLARWISPPKATWRVFGFELYDMHPPVQPLLIHTQRLQSIQFDDYENLEDVALDENQVIGTICLEL